MTSQMTYNNAVSLNPITRFKYELDLCKSGNNFNKGRLALFSIKIAVTIGAIAAIAFAGFHIATSAALIAAEFPLAARISLAITTSLISIVILNTIRKVFNRYILPKNKENIALEATLEQIKSTEKTLLSETQKAKKTEIALAQATAYHTEKKRVFDEATLVFNNAEKTLAAAKSSDQNSKDCIKKLNAALSDSKTTFSNEVERLKKKR